MSSDDEDVSVRGDNDALKQQRTAFWSLTVRHPYGQPSCPRRHGTSRSAAHARRESTPDLREIPGVGPDEPAPQFLDAMAAHQRVPRAFSDRRRISIMS